MSWLLVRTMILKELRTTLREKNQLVGLAISILAMCVGISVPAMKARDELVRRGISIQWTSDMIAYGRWLALLIGTGISVFFGMGFLLAAIMSCFASEKENRTLELALVSPVGDTSLFLAKCLSVLVPSMVLAIVFTTSVAVAVQLSMHQVMKFGSRLRNGKLILLPEGMQSLSMRRIPVNRVTRPES